MWHNKLKGTLRRTGYTEKVNPRIKLVTLGRGQIPLDFFKSMGICDGAHRLKMHFIPENAIKWPCTNSVDQDFTNQSEQADRDTPFLQTGCLNGLRCIAAETCKCNNNLTPEYIRDLVQLKTSSYSFRYENTVKVPTVPTVTYGQCSFRFESAQVWNSLPSDMRKVTEFAEFQCQIRSWTVQLVRNRSSCL